MLKFSLYENAIDSINHGFEHLQYAVEHDSKRDFKQAILSLFQGAELLLKELLCQIKPIYMFDKNSLFDKCADPVNPKLEELYNCKSVEISKLCSEVKKFYPNDFSSASLKVVEKLASVRNKIQHFCFDISKEETQSILLQLYHQVLGPSLKIISHSILNSKHNDFLNERLENIFCFMEVADQEAAFLKLSDRDFHRGSCFACGNWSFFIFYDGESYPQYFYCTSCNFRQDHIDSEEYRECPECGAYSLIYSPELEGGLCLWYKCANHKDGGVIIEMDYCIKCQDYKIEGKCKCNTLLE